MAVAASTTYRAVRGYVDHANRNSSVRFNIAAGAWAAYGTDTTAGDVHDMFAALDALSLDTPSLGRASKDFDEVGLTSLAPASEAAVNSAKLLVLIQETPGAKKFSMQIPARNPDAFTSQRGYVDIAAATRSDEITALLSAIASTVLSEDGAGVVVYQIRVIGKGTAA